MSLVTPDIGLLFWMVVIFGIVFFLLWKFGFPIITDMVEKRSAHIDESLKLAREAEIRMQDLAREQQQLIDQSKLEQTRILQEATRTRAEIIAKAGQAGKVTVATALAGRGTDIVLDDEARKAGGLYVLGFGHQNTRRGDRQLAGRSGRQGDPGKCRFFVSPEDELLLRFSPKHPETRSECIRAVKKAQENSESIAEAQRETTLKLDEVVGRFREAVYTARNEILRGRLPAGFEVYPPQAAKAILLAGIDEAWSAFLAETEDAKDRVELVSLAGKNYENEYIRDIAGMYRMMQEDVQKTAHRRLARLKDGVYHVGTV